MSNYQNHQTLSAFQKPTLAVWVQYDRQRYLHGMMEFPVALAGSDGFTALFPVLVPYDHTPPTKRRQLAALKESIDTFRILTAGYDLVLFDPEYDRHILNGNLDSDSSINFVSPALAEIWNLRDDEGMLKLSEEAMFERIVCVSSEGLHPALTKARWLLHAWRWCIANRQTKANPSFQ